MSKVVFKDGREVSPQRIKVKHMWWRYLLVWTAGAISSVVTIAVVAVCLGVSFTMKEIVNGAGGDIDQLLQPGYQNYSVLELATTLASSKFETLGDINKVTPIPKNILEEQINPILRDELHFEYPWEEISIKPFQLPVSSGRSEEEVDHDESLDVYIGRALKEGVTLASFVGEGAPNFVNVFLYPRDEHGEFDYDHPFTLMDFITADSDFYDDIVNGIRIKDVIANPDNNPLITAIGDWSINDFTDENIDGLSVGLFLSEDSEMKIIETLSGWTIGQLKDPDNFMNIRLDEVIERDNAPKMLQALMDLDFTIGMLENSDLYQVLRVQDVFDTDGSDVLEALATYYLADLEDEDTYRSLTLSTIYSPQEIADNAFLDALKDYPLYDLPNQIGNITLGALFDITPDAEGNTPLENTLAVLTINTLPDKINNLVLGEIVDFSNFDIDEEDLETLKQTPVNNYQDLVDGLKNSLKLKDVIDIVTEGENKSPEILISLQDCKLKDLASRLGTLELDEVIDIPNDAHPILKALSSTHILDFNALNTKISSLELCDIYTRSQCSGLLGFIWDANNNGHIAISDLPGAINNLPLTELLAQYIYVEGQYKTIGGVEYQKINPSWWYLLTEEVETDPSIYSEEKKFYVLGDGASYTVNNGLGKMVANFEYHMENESLRELYEAGLIDIEDSRVGYLNYPINYLGKTKIGDLTISEFLNWCIDHIINS